jgi:release factor glutamine methyltransferase
VAAGEEAEELVAAADGDQAALDELVARRLAGEPLAWLTGRTSFCGYELRIHAGVYVPRWQSTELARRAVAALPARGIAVDLCTGSGALAAVLQRDRPGARVVAADTDPRAVACARANGVDAYEGHLLDPLPDELAGAVDVVVSVPPYVPTPALSLLPRDTLAVESAAHYDGGPDGTDLLLAIGAQALGFLRPGSALLVELGGDQADTVGAALERLGYAGVETWADEDGDLRGLQAQAPPLVRSSG